MEDVGAQRQGQEPPPPEPVRPERQRAPFPFVPRLRLFGERVVVEDGQAHEVEAGVATLSFVYDGIELARDDPDEALGERQLGAEADASRLLESFGALDLDCVTDFLLDYDSRANYLIALASEVHVGASFTAHAAVELTKAGFEVSVEPSYPFQVVPSQTPWTGWLEPHEKPDWFRVQLGVEIEGKPYNLVPALLELLERCAEGSSMTELARCPARFRAVPLGDGRYVVLPWARLERILAVLAELHETGRSQVDLAAQFLLGLFALDRAFQSEGGALSWPNQEALLDRAQRLARPPEFRPRPAALKAELRPYQHEGLMWLEHLRDAGVGGVLADDMGLGKTLQTIALLAREREARRMDLPSLIVTPTSLIGNWLREFAKFAPHLRVRDYTGPGASASSRSSARPTSCSPATRSCSRITTSSSPCPSTTPSSTRRSSSRILAVWPAKPCAASTLATAWP